MLLMVLPGCASQAHRIPPSVPPAAGIGPALDAQARLIETAHRAFAQERYRLASDLFKRFIESNPNSPRLSEARWWLARSYEQGGDVQAALAAYRAAVAASAQSIPPADSYEFQALNRLDTIRRSLGPSSLLERRQVALWLTSEDWLPVPDAEGWIEQLADAGVTSLILDIGLSSPTVGESRPIGGVYVQTTKVPVAGDLFSAIVSAAHAKGLAVLASLNLHHPGWATVNPEWSTAVVGGIDQVMPPVGSVDVLHPDFQRFIGDVAQEVLRTDVDGLVFGARKAKGFAEQWSPTSRRMFAELFSPSSENHDQSLSAIEWRWAGWKTREYLGFVARLSQQLRQTKPGFVMAVAVHEQAVFSPVDALTDYGEDAIETKQRGLHLIVLPELGMAEQFEWQGARVETVRQRLMQSAGDDRQLWLGMALNQADRSSLVMVIRAMFATQNRPAGAHLLLLRRPVLP